MAFQLRDRHGASRAVAYLMLAGAPFVLVTGVVLTPDRPLPGLVAIVVTCVVVALGGWACWSRPHLLPNAFWLFAPFVSAVVISGLNLATEDASSGAQLFYLWPVLYAANFLSRRVIYLTLAVVFGGDAVVVFVLQPPVQALSDSSSMALAMTMTAVVVVTLRERADRLLAETEEQARGDALTGLANRRSFDDALARDADWARRNNASLALITIDVDHFKKINDSWGHVVGDQALQAVAAAIRSVAQGDDDVAARLGGDEFALLMRVDRVGAAWAAEKLQAAVGAIESLPGGPPGVSIGVAVLPDDASSAQTLVSASDAALYDAKTRGRGRVSQARDTSQERHLGNRNPHLAEIAGRS